MGTFVDGRPREDRKGVRPLVVELVGLAGVGKTTLTGLLSQRSSAVLPVEMPYYRDIQQMSFFVRNTYVSLPWFVKLARHRQAGWFSRSELAWFVILEGWPRSLRERPSNGEAALLLDQGPVFLLATLDEFGPGVLARREAQNWWSRMYRQCAGALDMVIWLDAPNEVCAQRIRRREKWHMVKDAPDETIFEFAERFRTAYERVIARLADAGVGPRVLRLNTGVNSPDEVADRILVACGIDDGRGESEAAMTRTK
jgi:shikimate kinase